MTRKRKEPEREQVLIGVLPPIAGKWARDREKETSELKVYKPSEHILSEQDFEALTERPEIRRQIVEESVRRINKKGTDVWAKTSSSDRIELSVNIGGDWVFSIKELEILDMAEKRVRLYWDPDTKDEGGDSGDDDDPSDVAPVRDPEIQLKEDVAAAGLDPTRLTRLVQTEAYWCRERVRLGEQTDLNTFSVKTILKECDFYKQQYMERRDGIQKSVKSIKKWKKICFDLLGELPDNVQAKMRCDLESSDLLVHNEKQPQHESQALLNVVAAEVEPVQTDSSTISSKETKDKYSRFPIDRKFQKAAAKVCSSYHQLLMEASEIDEHYKDIVRFWHKQYDRLRQEQLYQLMKCPPKLEQDKRSVWPTMKELVKQFGLEEKEETDDAETS